jgi:sodium-dependent dicarboxylate transporter 2/3/5
MVFWYVSQTEYGNSGLVASFWFDLLDTSDFRKLPCDILHMISGGLAMGVALNLSGLGNVFVAQLPTDISLAVVLAMSLEMGTGTMLSLVLAVSLMSSMDMALPVTTQPNAIAFSSRAIQTKDMMIAGSIITVFGFVVISLVGPWYWQMVLGFLGLS